MIKDLRRPVGCTNVITRPETPMHALGRPMWRDGWWTGDIAEYLKELVDKKSNNYKCNMSLLKLISKIGQDQHAKTLHYFTDDARENSGKVVSRPEIDMDFLRKYGKLRHIRRILYGKQEAEEADGEGSAATATDPTAIPTSTHGFTSGSTNSAFSRCASVSTDEGYGGQVEELNPMFMPR